jgi:ribosomal protein S18 acetylase RimI-like enzyme
LVSCKDLIPAGCVLDLQGSSSDFEALIQPLGVMEMIVRAARESDAADLARIGAATFALACPPNTPEADIETYISTELTPERFLAHMACSSTALFAATLQEAVVGYLMLCRDGAPIEVGEHDALEIRRIYVMPEFHGKGIAQALMRQSLICAAEAGCRKVWLGVSQHNQRGIAFYAKAGFAVVGEKKFFVGSDIHDDYVMCCELEPQLVSQESGVNPGAL